MSILGRGVRADRGGMAAARDLNIGLTPEEVQAIIAAALAQQQDDRVKALAQQLGATEVIIRRVLVVLAPHVEQHELQPDSLPDLVCRLIEERVAALQEQRLLAEGETNPGLRTLRQRVVAAQTAGDDSEASSALEEIVAFHRERRLARQAKQTQLAAAIEGDSRSEAEALAQRAQIARTQLRYRDAAARFAEAADLTAFDPGSSWRHRLSEAGALYDLGSEAGDNAALADAILVCEQVLTLVPRDAHVDDWATTQNYLGAVLATLGEQTNCKATLARAVEAFNSALEDWTRERSPQDWALTQNNLGAALRALGARNSCTATLERAVTAYELALEEWTRERSPQNWALTQNNLGVALQALGTRNSCTATLERAVTVYGLALEEQTRERVPFDWAMTQNNLGNALATLGARENHTAKLRRAVRAYELALEEWTRERVQLKWAATQNNLGGALTYLGERETGTATLERAVTVYGLALKERTRELAPLAWAETQQNLATARLEIGRRRGDAGELRAALVAVDGALEVFRAGKAEFDLEQSERLRAAILTAIGGPVG